MPDATASGVIGPRAIVVFARAPRLGTVKTRLAAELGDDEALSIYRRLGAMTMRAVEGVAACEVVVACTPDDAGDAICAWLGSVRCEPQQGTDLGSRMLAAIAARAADGMARTLVVGTDCPGLTPTLLEEAFARLDDADVVFGPATDGGYYLVGMARPHAHVFHDVPWSSEATLAVSLARAAAAGLRVALLPALRDIDTAADWRAYRAAAVE